MNNLGVIQRSCILEQRGGLKCIQLWRGEEGENMFRVPWLTLLFWILSTCHPVPGESFISSPLVKSPLSCGVHKTLIDTQAP